MFVARLYGYLEKTFAAAVHLLDVGNFSARVLGLHCLHDRRGASPGEMPMLFLDERSVFRDHHGHFVAALAVLDLRGVLPLFERGLHFLDLRVADLLVRGFLHGSRLLLQLAFLIRPQARNEKRKGRERGEEGVFSWGFVRYSPVKEWPSFS